MIVPITKLKLAWCLLLLGFITSTQSQERIEKIGKITYKSSQNIYVQFDNTNGMIPGDTLFTKSKSKLLPALKVSFISSRSCAGTPINMDNLKIGDQLIAIIHFKPIIRE